MNITTRITAIAAAGARAQAAGRHCVVHLAEHGRTGCHRTFRQAIADATGGQITDAGV